MLFMSSVTVTVLLSLQAGVQAQPEKGTYVHVHRLHC